MEARLDAASISTRSVPVGVQHPGWHLTRPAICSPTDVTTAGPSNSRRHRRNGSTQTNRSGPAPRIDALLVGDGWRWLVRVRQQHPTARQREVQRRHLRGLPGGPDRLHRDTRQTDLPLVVPDPHRRALAVRRHGRRCRRHFVGGPVEAPRHVDRHTRSRLEPLNFPYSTAVISASSLVDRATADTDLNDFGMDGWQRASTAARRRRRRPARRRQPGDIEAAAANRLDDACASSTGTRSTTRPVTRLSARDHRRPAQVGDDGAAPPAGARPAVPLPAGVELANPMPPPDVAHEHDDPLARPAPRRDSTSATSPPSTAPPRQPRVRPALPRPGARLAAADVHPVVARRRSGERSPTTTACSASCTRAGRRTTGC
jgi:hypothetical protein